MTPSPDQDLSTIERHVAERLAAAADSRRGAWRVPVLSTVTADGGPTARTVVVRSIDIGQRRLEIFTDTRSAKVGEIAVAPRVALTFWDPDAAEQLRMSGTAATVEDTDLVDARWAAIGPRGRGLYRTSPEPVDDGRSRFTVLHVTWTAWDWLWIGDVTHRRAHLTWSSRGDVSAHWVDP